MAIWRITEDLQVTYLKTGDQPHDCGTAEDATLRDVEVWASCEASPWDLVHSPTGSFVRQRQARA